MKAYQVCTDKSAYKTLVEDGKIKPYAGGNNGIDISFEADDHATDYFRKKREKPGARLIEWEFNDDLFAMIKAKVDHVGANKLDKSWLDPNSKKGKMWKEVEKLPAPTNTTDPHSRDLVKYAPHFSVEWIDVLNKYAVGGAAKVYTFDQYFGSEQHFLAEELVWFYPPDQASDGFVTSKRDVDGLIANNTDFDGWKIASKAEAIKNNYAGKDAFDQ